MNPIDCPLYDKCHYVKIRGDKMCPQDDCGKYGQYISRLQGAREFAKWLSNTEYVANHDSFILPLRGYFTVDEVVAEWQKGDK